MFFLVHLNKFEKNDPDHRKNVLAGEINTLLNIKQYLVCLGPRSRQILCKSATTVFDKVEDFFFLFAVVLLYCPLYTIAPS